MPTFNLKTFREDHHLTQIDIAKALDVPQSSISAMESGRSRVSSIYIDTLVKKFKVENVEQYYIADSPDTTVIRNNRGRNIGSRPEYTEHRGSSEIVTTKVIDVAKDVEDIKKILEQRIKELDERCQVKEREIRDFIAETARLKAILKCNNIEF